MSARGFTLVELMVVIVVIGIFATVGFVTYTSAQKSARISNRVQDLQAIQTAIEMYKLATGKYPFVATAGTAECVTVSLPGQLVPTYMPAMPNDPLGPSYCYQYNSNSNQAGNNATEYKIRTNISLWASSDGEMGNSDFLQQPNMIDPANDADASANCLVNTAGNVKAWALYSGSIACAYQ